MFWFLYQESNRFGSIGAFVLLLVSSAFCQHYDVTVATSAVAKYASLSLHIQPAIQDPVQTWTFQLHNPHWTICDGWSNQYLVHPVRFWGVQIVPNVFTSSSKQPVSFCSGSNRRVIWNVQGGAVFDTNKMIWSPLNPPGSGLPLNYCDTGSYLTSTLQAIPDLPYWQDYFPHR